MAACLIPGVLMLREWNGNWGFAGAVLFLFGPGLVLLPFAFWSLYSDAKRRRDEEFRE